MAAVDPVAAPRTLSSTRRARASRLGPSVVPATARCAAGSTVPRVPHPLLLMANRAPVLPPALYRQMLTSLRGKPDPALLTALLRRTEVPLSDLAPMCKRLTRQEPGVVAAYLSRPEQSKADLEALLDADPREEVLLALFKQRPISPAAVLAALPRCTDVVTISYVVRGRFVPAELAAAAVVRAADLMAEDPEVDSAGTATPRSAAAPRARDNAALERAKTFERLLGVLGRDAQLADAVAPLTADSRLLGACVHQVSTATAADAVATRWLQPLLAGDVSRDQLRDARIYAPRLGRLCSPALRSQMADWWTAASLPVPERSGSVEADRRMVTDIVAQLRGTGLRDRPLHAVLGEDFPFAEGAVELASLLAAEFGDDSDRWRAYAELAGDFTGTVDELLATVRAVTACRGQTAA